MNCVVLGFLASLSRRSTARNGFSTSSEIQGGRRGREEGGSKGGTEGAKEGGREQRREGGSGERGGEGRGVRKRRNQR